MLAMPSEEELQFRFRQRTLRKVEGVIFLLTYQHYFLQFSLSMKPNLSEQVLRKNSTKNSKKRTQHFIEDIIFLIPAPS